MNISFTKLNRPKKGALVCGVVEGGKLSPTAYKVDNETNGLISTAISCSQFTGRSHQTLNVFTPSNRILLIGLGKPSQINLAFAEKSGGVIYEALANSGEEEATIMMEVDDFKSVEIAAHLALGALLRSYRFDSYKTKITKEERPSLVNLFISIEEYSYAKKVYEVEAAVAEGVFFTRDLVSEPANILFPSEFAKRVALMTSLGLKIDILEEKEMARLGMSAMLGVGQGSEHESQVVIMLWEGGDKNQKSVAFIGKGVCFDTGGISLKPSTAMEEMKFDMGGAGVVCGLMRALAKRKAKANVIGVIGLVENMPDGKAQRPGDIVRSMSGQTIEIVNTDAEGRLILADLLWYTQDQYKPEFMINIATLTGAMVVALGEETCGYFSNNDILAGELQAAANAVDEAIWRMPMGEVYNKQMDSDVADMKNAGSRWAGAITAACFLERFVNNIPWIHMDIAGVTWLRNNLPTAPKGASGFGVRALNRLVLDHCEKKV
ncbi:cytosol aminopeptidase family, catalytic domain protein [Candidatus Endolissoclinum faulkneri L2]|uniref:Probable cytosol aminopeptidase n=1 Tax=Candidatus Endolissoclinum faulkneri L2 TaxID=1193729 RepID=K7YNI6_9PROT|nr:leucyl aminopeptidase [Candidatus Endolissoclinum faulkneri]AFX99087.1 cytosol aminopeptidase family, catalytic domain protein [Candidatus Endolissoclinum faulkneri L2]